MWTVCEHAGHVWTMCVSRVCVDYVCEQGMCGLCVSKACVDCV